MFRKENINHAIVQTIYNLTVPEKGEGWRLPEMTPEHLDGWTFGLLGYCYGDSNATGDVPESERISYIKGFEEETCLELCRKLAADCDRAQKELIVQIVHTAMKHGEEMRSKPKFEQDVARFGLDIQSSSNWGKLIRSLIAAFDIAVYLPDEK